MLRRDATLFFMRNRKKWPYMVHHNKLPWNTVEPGTELSHKVLAPCVLKLLQAASALHINGLVMHQTERLPAIPEDQWLFALPASTFIVPFKRSTKQSLVNVQENESEGQDEEEEAAADSAAASAATLAPYGWFGKRVQDDMSLTHYGPLNATIAPVREVAEFRSPDLRIVCNAIRFGRFYDTFHVSPRSSFSANSNTNNGNNNNNNNSNNNTMDNNNNSSSSSPHKVIPIDEFCVYHFYRPNRAPSELEGAFKQFLNSPVERPDLSALEEIVAKGGSWKPTLSRKTTSVGGTATASPMPQGPVPTSPQFGLIEREAIRPGDTFGSRARPWGHFW